MRLFFAAALLPLLFACSSPAEEGVDGGRDASPGARADASPAPGDAGADAPPPPAVDASPPPVDAGPRYVVRDGPEVSSTTYGALVDATAECLREEKLVERSLECPATSGFLFQEKEESVSVIPSGGRCRWLNHPINAGEKQTGHARITCEAR